MDLTCDRSAFVDLAPSRARFAAVRELHGRASEGAPHEGRGLLEAARFGCRAGVRVRGHECSACAHFLNLVPDEDHRGATLRCVFHEDDPISAIMAAPERIACVAAGAAAAEVVRAAFSNRVTVVALVEGNRVVGTVKVSAAAHAPAAEARSLAVPAMAVPAETSVGVVTQALARRHAEAIFVCEGDRVVGLVAAPDLIHAGIET